MKTFSRKKRATKENACFACRIPMGIATFVLQTSCQRKMRKIYSIDKINLHPCASVLTNLHSPMCGFRVPARK